MRRPHGKYTWVKAAPLKGIKVLGTENGPDLLSFPFFRPLATPEVKAATDVML